MPTTPLAGDRGRRARNPRDITGVRYAQQQAAQEARQAAPTPSVEDVHNHAFRLGFAKGHAAGIESFSRALHAMYKRDGIEAVQEYLSELDEAGE